MVRSLVVAVLATVALGAAVPAAHAAPGIKGTVVFDGEPPERLKLRRDTDPYCAKLDQAAAKLSDDVIVTHGKLKDVVIRIQSSSAPPRAGKAAPLPPPARIDQTECTYAPRVLAVVAGQQLAVHNSDGTFHNVHGTAGGKQLWNKPASPGDPELALDTTAKPGEVIDVVCDVHPWMHAYALVVDRAPFAVT